MDFGHGKLAIWILAGRAAVDDDMVVQITVHKPIADTLMRFDIHSAPAVFVSTADIVEPVYWKRSPAGFIVAIVPDYC